MRPPRKDLTNQTLNSWKVLSYSHRKTYPGGQTANYWNCVCTCGNAVRLQQSSLLNGTSSQCGYCGHGEPDGWRHSLYSTWLGMKGRCLSPNHVNYGTYGALGIKVYEPWIKSFQAFQEYVGNKPGPEYTLDRYPDPYGDYAPGNVRWATPKQQRANCRALKERIKPTKTQEKGIDIPPKRDLTGQSFGDWTVLSFSHRQTYPSGSTVNHWLCVCSCGIEATVRQSNLLSGASSGCGHNKNA